VFAYLATVSDEGQALNVYRDLFAIELWKEGNYIEIATLTVQ
jgi:hypothetical protein